MQNLVYRDRDCMGKASFYFFYFLLRVKRLTFDQKFRTMKKLLFLIVFVFPVFVFAQVSVDAGCFRHVDSSTGLSAVYVIGNENTVTMHYTSSSTDEIYWYRFGAEGLSSRVEMMGTQSGNVSVLVSSYKDCGYMVKQNSDSLCFWISSYRSVGSCEAGEEQENICEKVLLSGEGFAIPYYTTQGQRKYLSRWVSYETSKWDDAAGTILDNVSVVSEAEVLSDTEMEVPTPYGTTQFTVVDSRPLAWGGSISRTITGDYVSPAILMRAVAEQTLRGAANEAAEQPSGGFGGSAPVDMSFTAYVNGDNYYAWEFSATQDFSTVDAIYAERQLAYSFRNEGTTYVRLHAYNDYCERDTVFEISVGESKLEAPNVFSPYGSPGVNDEWKVAYKSIVEFKCWIFNRWGEQIYHYQDPSGGWDGRYHGKLVPPGVYYYVIEARGADGQKYKLKGHINILRSKNK